MLTCHRVGSPVLACVTMAGLVVCLTANPPAERSSPAIHHATLREVSIPHGLSSIGKMVTSGETIFLLDQQSHRIVKTANFGPVRVVATLGNANGQVYYPFDMAVNDAGLLSIKDGGNERIQVLDTSNRVIGVFPDRPKSIGLALGGGDRVFLGQPALGNLVTVYDFTGRRLRSFGALIKLSDVYGKERQNLDGSYRTAMNRVRLALDDHGDLWAAFLHAPVVMKFGADGARLLSMTLQSPGIDAMRRAFGTDLSQVNYASSNYDNVQLIDINKDITFAPASGTLLVLHGNNEITVLRGDGTIDSVIEPRMERGGVIQSIAASRDGTIYACLMFQANVYRIEVRD